jgi:predicted RNA binding protein YcfA (HicA-like mRNA interferase family)
LKFPRDISGSKLAQALKKLGYQVTRQTGSHLRLTTRLNGEHHITIPNHDFVRVGTLANVLDEVASHFKIHRSELIKRIFKL